MSDAVRTAKELRSAYARIAELELFLQPTLHIDTLHAILNQLPDMVWSSDPDGRTDFVNSRWQEYTGLTIEQLNEQGWQAVNHPDDVAAMHEKWAQTAQKSEPFEADLRYRRHDGQYHWFRGRAIPIKDRNGRIIKWVGTAREIPDQALREEELLEHNAVLRGFCDGPGVMRGIVEVVDEDILHISANAAAAAFFGSTIESLHGRRASAIGVPEETVRMWVRHFEESQISHQPVSFEYYDEGAGKWLCPTVGCLDAGPTGNRRFSYIAVDITKRQQAEAKLTQQRAVLEAIIESSIWPVFSVDRSYCYISFNSHHAEAMKIFFGAEIEIGRNMLDYHTNPEDRLKAQGNLDRALAGECVTVRSYYGEESQTRRHYEISHNPIWDATGHVIGVAVCARDLTEHKQAEQSLRESEERFRAMAETVPEILFMTSPDGSVDYLNARFGEFSGMPPDSGEGFGWAVIIHPEDRDRTVARWMESVRTGEQFEIEYRLRRSDGDYRWFIGRARAVRDDDGNIVRWFGAVSDIDELKRAEAALRKAHDELDMKVHERTTELQRANQTLRMINECSQVLVRVTDEIQLVREICRILHNQGGFRMVWVGYAQNDDVGTVKPMAWVGAEDGYLSAIHFTSADKKDDQSPTGVCIRLAEVRACQNFPKEPELLPWRDEALSCGYRSSIALPLKSAQQAFGALTIYSTEPEAFGAIQAALLAELADNLAFGITALRAQVERDHARLIAEDRAVQLQALATELGQVEQRVRQRLAKVLHDHLQQLLVAAKFGLATAEGKGIEIEELEAGASEVNRSILIAPAGMVSPVVEAPADAALPPQSGSITASVQGVEPLSCRKIRVLLADDHPVMRQELARVLQEQPDIEIVGEACDGEEAVELTRNAHPDVVLMDVSMPRTNGLDATRRIIAEMPKVCIIGLSMHEEDEMAAAMRRAGAVACLTKGGPVERLISTVRTCVSAGVCDSGAQPMRQSEPGKPPLRKKRKKSATT